MALLALAFIAACTTPTTPEPDLNPPDITGSWVAAGDWHADLIQNGTRVTGTMGGPDWSRAVDGYWLTDTSGEGTLAGFLTFTWEWEASTGYLVVRSSQVANRKLTMVREGS